MEDSNMIISEILDSLPALISIEEDYSSDKKNLCNEDYDGGQQIVLFSVTRDLQGGQSL